MSIVKQTCNFRLIISGFKQHEWNYCYLFLIHNFLYRVCYSHYINFYPNKTISIILYFQLSILNEPLKCSLSHLYQAMYFYHISSLLQVQAYQSRMPVAYLSSLKLHKTKVVVNAEFLKFSLRTLNHKRFMIILFCRAGRNETNSILILLQKI